jgi:hypothetical protein
MNTHVGCICQPRRESISLRTKVDQMRAGLIEIAAKGWRATDVCQVWRGREVTRGLDVLTKMEALETRREVRCSRSSLCDGDRLCMSWERPGGM